MCPGWTPRKVVGASGFEPPTSWSRTRKATILAVEIYQESTDEQTSVHAKKPSRASRFRPTPRPFIGTALYAVLPSRSIPRARKFFSGPDASAARRDTKHSANLRTSPRKKHAQPQARSITTSQKRNASAVRSTIFSLVWSPHRAVGVLHGSIPGE